MSSAPSAPVRQPANSRFAVAMPVTILLALFCYYLAIFLRYRPYDIDNPWFLSFSYDTFVEHIHSDQFMNVRYPQGMDGTQLFGKIAAFIQYIFLSHAHWQQGPAVTLSSSMVAVALMFWWLQLRKLGFGPQYIAC